jgi:hypothetical protein
VGTVSAKRLPRTNALNIVKFGQAKAPRRPLSHVALCESGIRRVGAFAVFDNLYRFESLGEKSRRAGVSAPALQAH